MLMGNKKVKYEDKTLQALKEIYEDVTENTAAYDDYKHTVKILDKLRSLANKELAAYEDAPVTQDQVSILKEVANTVVPISRSVYKTMVKLVEENEDFLISSLNHVWYTEIASEDARPNIESMFDVYRIWGTTRRYLVIDNHIVSPRFEIKHYNDYDDVIVDEKFGKICFSLVNTDNNLYWYSKRKAKVASWPSPYSKRYQAFTCVEKMGDSTYFGLTQREYRRILEWMITVCASQIIALHTSLLTPDSPQQRMMGGYVSLNSVL